MHFALWGFNGSRFCRNVGFRSEMSPAPYSKLLRRHLIFLICADKTLMLLFLRDFSNRYGRASSRNGDHENIMRPLWDWPSLTAGHLDRVSCRWVLYYGAFLGLSDYSISLSKSFNPCFSTICRPLVADSLAVEEAIFSFFDISTALIPSSRVPQ